ncbi:MAG: hypothetical protein JW750_09655 [Anaerolineaceae bacterium]|nr:hypothetical protein [Anaerolineaceae bacterium]
MDDSNLFQDQLARAVSLYQSRQYKEADEIMRPILEANPENIEAWRVIIQYARSKMLRSFYLSTALAKNPDHPALIDLARQYQISPNQKLVSTLSNLLEAPDESAIGPLARELRPRLRATTRAAYLPPLFGFFLALYLMLQSFNGFYQRVNGSIRFPSIGLAFSDLFFVDLQWVNRWIQLFIGMINWVIIQLQERLWLGILTLFSILFAAVTLYSFLRLLYYSMQMRRASKHIQGTIIGQWTRNDSDSRRYFLACAFPYHHLEIQFYQAVSRAEYLRYRAGDPVLVRHLNNSPKIARMELDTEFQPDNL